HISLEPRKRNTYGGPQQYEMESNPARERSCSSAALLGRGARPARQSADTDPAGALDHVFTDCDPAARASCNSTATSGRAECAGASTSPNAAAGREVLRDAPYGARWRADV